MAEAPELIMAVMQVLEEEEDEEEEMMMLLARLAADEIMELEEGGLDFVGDAWVPVTVVINDYHILGDPCFRLHFRMSRIVFEILTETIGNHLRERGRLRRQRTPLQDIMLMVIWLLATPDSFRSVALRFGVHPTTLHYFYSYVIQALRELSPQYISWPDAEERQAISDSVQRATGFPGVVGCIDGTHVFITAPVEDAAAYRNRHHSYSLNVQAVVDHRLLVRDLHVGEVGSMHDGRVFRRSPLHNDLVRRDGRLGVDEHLLGDGGYTLTDFMMIPFPNDGHLNAGQRRFNRMLSQARVRVEHSFGRAKGKWRRLKFLHARNQEYVVDYITAAFVLHNFIILNGEPMFDDAELGRPLNPNEVLGGEGVFDDEEELDVDQVLLDAQARGIEKRAFIMDHILQDGHEE